MRKLKGLVAASLRLKTLNGNPYLRDYFLLQKINEHTFRYAFISLHRWKEEEEKQLIINEYEKIRESDNRYWNSNNGGRDCRSFGGKAALWAAFLAWVGGGSLAAGGGGMAAGAATIAALGPVGWTVAGIGDATAGIAIYKARKRNRKAKNR